MREFLTAEAHGHAPAETLPVAGVWTVIHAAHVFDQHEEGEDSAARAALGRLHQAREPLV